MAVSQKDIAKRVGVSQQLVTRALNGHPRVASDTRQRIILAAAELGYDARENNDARLLIARRHGKRARTDVLAMLLPCGQQPGAVIADPYLLPMLSGIEAEADRRGCSLLLSSWAGPGQPLKRPITASAVDGVLIISAEPPWVDAVAEVGIPFINLFGHDRPALTIVPDEQDGTRLATEHMIELGHRRIAYLGQLADGRNQRARFAGYRQAMTDHGIPVADALVELTLPNPRRQSGSDGMQRILERSTDFTSLVCYNDTVAMGAVAALNSAGLRVPEDVSVVGFDNTSDDYDFSPRLTSVSFNRFAFGEAAVAFLSEQVDRTFEAGRLVELPAPHRVTPVELAVRESTAPVNATRG